MHRQTIAMQVAEAEAATARLVAQLAEPSAEDHAAAEHASPVQSEDVFRPGKQSAPVIQKGSKPPAKQHAGTSRKSAASARVTGASNTGKAQKRGSGIVSVDGVTAGGKPDPKRQKLAGASSSTKQAAAGPRKNTAAQETLGGDPASFVGREVQQEFEEGVFKVMLHT